MKHPLLAALPFLFTTPSALAQIDTPLGPFHLTTLGATLLNRFVPELWTDLGLFRHTVKNVGQRACVRLTDGDDAGKAFGAAYPVNVEDIAMDRVGKIAFMGSDPVRRKADGSRGWMPGSGFLDAEFGSSAEGAVWAYHYGKSEGGMTKLEIEPPLPSFHPHGMASLRLENGTVRLFVVNHRAEVPYNKTALYSVVEVLDYTPTTSSLDEPQERHTKLNHITTIQHPHIYTPNNLSPISPTAFYVSNDHAARSGTLRTLEEFAQYPSAWLTYCDFTRSVDCSVAYTGLRSANGVATDGKGLVLVSEVSGGDVLAFRHHPSTDSHTPPHLELTTRYNLDYVPDNIGYDPVTDTFTPVGHPRALAFLAFAEGHAPTAPSWADAITADGSISRVWSDDGGVVAGSTVFEVDVEEDVAFVSGVYDQRGVVRCRVPEGFGR
ncbi:uncharacterized protein EV422DRAFT_510649 [Fimicolochytrium jonesii]|uniref:uncharacterized protein n=1 Tax=Fimicolochytrium jonesii TaxID=1396493 RepID=UPI0022FE670C|nr:uncharacterized protein EV422DRAFT_510649 [Fimicolochytrium jonesii]KAI8826557.1 hypothetical protein EV422DRAFT_510649 [Fimicolochytrium jonesii]